MRTKELFLGLILILGTGCVDQEGTDRSAVPNLDVECSSAQVFTPQCRTSGDILWIGITKDYSLDCATVLAISSSTQRNSYFDAFAENITLTKSGFIVSASITSWQSGLGGSAGAITNGSYKICAFIESPSGNGHLDLGEPIGSGDVTVGGPSPQVANDWKSY